MYQVSKEGLGGWARWEGVAQAGGAALQRRGSVNRHADVCARTHAEIESGVVQHRGYAAGQRSAEPRKSLHGSWRPLSLFMPEDQGFPTLIFSSESPGEHFDIHFPGPHPERLLDIVLGLDPGNYICQKTPRMAEAESDLGTGLGTWREGAVSYLSSGCYNKYTIDLVV